ncbi:hypothetical protein [Paracandidimonas lactea]|uniref:hypothetical protein n=1 Tax=Paracandidimonas lactea TaxID=2895524 RepID=UPI001F33D39F|nr:hypothetical protein [Paracandidimonas lactea]
MTSESEGLSTDDVRKYLQRICREAEDMMRTFDPALITEWMETNLLDGTAVQADLRIAKNGSHVGTTTLTLEKEDLLQMGGIFGSMANRDNISDYSLEVNIHDVVTHGADAATVKVTWHEHITFSGPPAPGSETGVRMSVSNEADCCHLVVRDDGTLKLGLTLCSGTVQLTVSD